MWRPSGITGNDIVNRAREHLLDLKLVTYLGNAKLTKLVNDVYQ